tara:strand:- start:825 stop:1067 length:243 start_codon:yes stop_codon:yes gene_type:complete
MNKYDKDMMHERELIYDTKGQLHGADKEYKEGDKSKKQEMIHDRELIADAKTAIHNIDEEKHGHEASAHKILKHSRRNRK